MKLRVVAPGQDRPHPAASAPVLVAPDTFTRDECAAIIALSETCPAVPASASYDAAALTDLHDRSGRAWWLGLDARTDWIYARLDEVIDAANSELYGLELDTLETLQLSAYEVGDHFGTHTDFGFLHATRLLSASVQLSDPDTYEGGDLEFVGARYQTSADGVAFATWDTLQGRASRAQGGVTLFPANAPHRVSPVTRGVRWSLVVWVRGRPWT